MKIDKIIAVTQVETEDGTRYVRASPKNWFFACPCGCEEWYRVTLSEYLEKTWQEMLLGETG
jgi:hypothetical protein